MVLGRPRKRLNLDTALWPSVVVAAVRDAPARPKSPEFALQPRVLMNKKRAAIRAAALNTVVVEPSKKGKKRRRSNSTAANGKTAKRAKFCNPMKEVATETNPYLRWTIKPSKAKCTRRETALIALVPADYDELLAVKQELMAKAPKDPSPVENDVELPTKDDDVEMQGAAALPDCGRGDGDKEHAEAYSGDKCSKGCDFVQWHKGWEVAARLLPHLLRTADKEAFTELCLFLHHLYDGLGSVACACKPRTRKPYILLGALLARTRQANFPSGAKLSLVTRSVLDIVNNKVTEIVKELEKGA